jgi:hypothetical protein
LKAYPPVYLLKDEGSPVCEQNTTVLTEDYQAVRLPDWLIEPPTGEIERIKVREFLSKIKTSEINLGLSKEPDFKFTRVSACINFQIKLQK